ncbi:methyl-accepting chemotaxis protein [Anaeromyxobacter oryzisoli]|uniref:hypothetical protein n=1 Tax=Anaeromyxobacter oryzisoli TaxID=2925408 RepID=UPI001F5AB444|nr:hypothetical protein [Anaeromyxobacter sp. SG63]
MEPGSTAPAAPDAASDAAPDVEVAPRRGARRLRNYLLDTGLQLRLARRLLAVAVVLSAGLGYLLWEAWRETSALLELSGTELDASLGPTIAGEDRVRIVLVAVALAAVVACLLAAAVVITHRIAGPAYALRAACRRVAEGDLSAPRPLRARDLLVELGDEVAGMIEALRAREAGERDRLLAVAAALRAAEASGADRTRAAAELEAMAAEKHRRIAP